MAATMIGCILMLSVAGTLAGPISWGADSSTCATKCPESVKFAYEPTIQYEYTYENDIQTSIPGSTEEQSSLHMRATVQIEVLSPCEFNLKLTDVSLQDSQPLQYQSRQHVDNAWEFKRLLQEKGLRFGFIDGEIEHVCPEDEPVWVLNIKRGILSAFQNTQRTLDAATTGRETDVSGDCPVEYSVTSSGRSGKQVKKVKNMLGCSDRHGGDTSFTGSPYEIDSSIKSLPLMKTTHECEQQINRDGVLIQTVCKELHVFRPFSDGQGGAQTSVTYKLEFTKQSRGGRTTATPIRRRSSLLFDHTLSAAEEEQKLNEASETMRALCASVKDEDVRPETPHLFAELVRLMRTLDARALQQLQGSAASMCPQAEKYFRDAIPNIGTAASLTMIRNLISQGRVEDSEAAVWLTHLAFVPQPSREMLGAVSPLLRQSGEIQRKAALAISSMVHNYCKMNEDCAEADEVKAIIKIFTDNLSYNCRTDGDTEKRDTILMALKALGNTGNALDASQTLVRCFQNDQETMEIRIAAIQAFRRMSCNPESMELMRVFGDENEDSEVRIAAYLMLMNCPNEDIVMQIQRILSDEEVNQVGSFVYSHLTNLMESSDPSKRELREILQSIDLKVFDLDMRKFSRNIEWSLFSDMINTGAKAESNVIFSSQSYIPRSAMVNMTVDLFGHSVNLFEFGGRVEGLEQFIESMFRGDDNSVRQKRDVIRPSLLEYLDQQFKVAEHDGPKASYFFKIFGNEIHYDDFHGLDLEQLKDKMNFLDWLIKLSQEQQLDYSKSMMFLDSELVVPTAVGLPLRLAVDGTATVNVKMDGKMDVRQMFSNPSTVDINGSIKPSAAVELCSEMVVDAFVAKTGLKMVSTIHSSTVTQGKIALLDGKVFHFDLEMPRDKQEIINTQSKFFVLYRDEEREQRMIEQGRVSESECYDLTKALGIEVCGEVSLPVLGKEDIAKYPFTGPSSAAIYINKKDTFSKYHVEGSLEVGKKSSETEFKLNINTPGSKVDREIDIFFNLNPAQKTVDLNMKSPWKKATMRGEVTDTESMKRVSATATMDDRRTYSFVSEVAIEAKKFGTTYTPKVELAMHNKPTKSLSGQIFYRDNKKFEIDLQLSNVFRQPVKCEGSVSKVANARRMKYVVNLDIKSSAIKGNVDGFIDHLGDTMSSRIAFGYKNAKNEEERIIFSNKASDKSTPTLTSWSLTTGLTTTLWPRYNTDVKADFMYGRNTFSSKLDAGFDDRRRIVVSNSASLQSSPRELSMNAAAMLEVPYKNLKYDLTVDHLHNKRVFNSSATLGYHNQVAEARIDARRETTDLMNAYAKAFLTFQDREMSISHTISEKKPNEYQNDVVVRLDRNTQATGNVLLKMKQGLYDVSGDFSIPGLKPIEVEGQYKPDLYDFQAGAAAKYDNKKYHGKAEWSVPRNLKRNFEGTHSISFGCPARSMKLSGKLSKNAVVWSGEHELMLDMEQHPERTINTDWSITLNPTKPKVFAKAAWFPRMFVQMEAEGSYETEGWYRTTNDLQGGIKFTSSFPMLESISANIKHDYGHNVIESSGDVSWGRGQTITAALKFNKNTWQDVDATVTVGTPFPGFRTMTLQGSHELSQKLDSMVSFTWEQKSIKLEAKGSADMRRHFIEGEASFTSPFPRFQALSISGKHQDNGRNFNSNVDLNWGRNRKISGTFTMMHQRNGYSINNNGEININTPFPGYRSNKMTWNHINKDNSVNMRIDTQQDNINRMVSLDGQLDSNPRKTELTGKVMLQIPSIPDGWIKLEHEHTRSSANSDLTVHWRSDRVIKYSHNVLYEPDSKLEVASKLTTPFFDDMTLESRTTKKGRKINTLTEIMWSPSAKIEVDGSTTLLGGPKFDSTLRVTTPFRGYERTVLNAKNDYTNDIWESHADLDIARRHYEIDTSLGMDSRKKLSIDTTKMDYGFLIDAEFSGQPRDFTTLLTGKIPYYNENPVGAELRVTCADLDNIKSSLTINTPWRQAQTIKATLGHKRPARGKFITDAAFEMPRYKGSISNTMNLQKWNNFDTKSTLQYQNKKIELTTEAKNSPNLQGTVTFVCPFTEPITLVAQHEGTLRNFQSGVEVSYMGGRKVSTDVEYSRRGTNLNALVRVVTPYTERMVATAKHNGPWKNFENEASLEYGSQRLAGSSKFNLNDYDLNASVDLETPFDEMRTLKAEYQHAGPLNDFTCNSALTINGKKGTHSMEFKNAKVMSGKVEINTPFPAARLLKAEFEHDAKKWYSFKNEGSFKWNNKEWSGNSELRWFANTLKVVGKLKAPSDTYLLKVNHKGNSNGFSNSAVVDLSTGQKYSADSSFETKPNGMAANFNIETPHESFDKMSGEFRQSSDRKTFTASAELKTPFKQYKRFAGDVTHTGSFTNFESTANIVTPFRKLPSATFKVTHKGDLSEFASTAEATYGNKVISGAANFKQTTRNMEGSASLQTPYSGYENFEGSFSQSGSLRNFKTSAEIKTPFRGHERYAGSLTHTGGSLTDFKSSAEVNTPFRGYERTAFMMQHNGDFSGMNSKATLETSIPNYDKFDFSINHNGDLKNLRTELKLNTPIREYQEFAINVNHAGDRLRDFNSELAITLPVRGYENWGIKVTHRGDLSQFQCTADITTPFRQVPLLELGINHRGSLTDFASGISAKWNRKVVDANAVWKYESTYYVKNYEGSLTVNTPWQNIDMNGQHKREGETKTGNLKVEHNQVQKVNLNYVYTTGAKKNIRVTFTEPKIFEVFVNFEGNGPSFKSDASFEWERKTNVKVELDIKNEMSGDNVDRQLTFKTSIPSREVGFDVSYTRDSEKMTQNTEIHWNRDQNSRMNYALELGSRNYRRQNYDGSFKFNSPAADFEATVGHVVQSAQQTTTTVSFTMDETLTIKRECTIHDSGMKLIFTVSHPRFSRDAILAVDAVMNDKVTEGEIDLQFEREAINFKGKIADEARSTSEMKYTASSQLSYPNMRLDMQFDGSMYNDRDSCGGEMEVNYQTSRDGMKTATSKLSYDKQSRSAVYEMVTPMTTVKVTGTKTIHDPYNGVHMFEIVAEKDNEAVRTEFGLDMSGRRIEAKFYTPRDAMLHIYAMYSQASAEFKVMRRLSNGQEVNDVVLNLNLDSDELVTGAAYMRPGIWEDIQELFNNPQFRAKMQRSFEPLKRALWQEWQQKQAAWERVSERPRAAFYAVYEDLSDVASKISRGVYRAYRANEFHLKDMYDAVADAYRTTKFKMQQSWRKTKAAMEPVLEDIKRGMQAGVYMLHISLERVSRDVSVMYQEANQKARAMYREYRPYVDRAIIKMKMTYKQVKEQVMSYYNQVRNHPKVQAMIETIQDLQPSDIFAPLRKLKYRMSTAIQKWKEEHQEVFDALEDVWNNIAQRQEIRDLAMFMEATIARAQRFWEKYDVQKNMKVWLKNMSKANWKNLRNMVMNYANDAVKLDKTRWTTYDPKNGNYGFEVYVPFDLKDMEKLPKMNIYSYIRQAQRVMDDLSFDEEWCIWDTIYKYMPRSLNVRDWIPPFKAHATLAGNQHYMTFDKKFYEFSGECSYLLARDFIDGYFSVVANYQSQSGEVSKKSMTVFCKDKQVEVFPDGQVMLDGRSTDLPLEVEGTIIKRVASMIFINNPNGINIDCDLVHDRCTVAVSGWYFGKTGGLLGTYDNEPVTDLMKPDNTLANTVEEMAESWIVGSRCRATNYAKVTREDEESPKYMACAKYFTETTSPFRPCFRQVDPEPFMTMCLNDEDSCDAASYYVNECKKNSVTIRQPRECVTCETPNGGEMIEGGNMTITMPPNSGDVVFVIQRGECNRDAMSKIADMVNYFEARFQDAGMRDVHYGIVGFGGLRPYDDPHTHTIGGRVMTTDTRMLLNSLDSITYDGPFPEDADVMSAVRYAAMYPFRMGVSKTVVVLPCADCREGATRYTELQRILIERDIRLHLLMDHTFTLRGTKSVSPRGGLMFGIDKNGMFIDKHVSDNELLGDAALRKQVTRPKDLCAALSEVSDGTVFDRDMLANQRPNVQKTFIDVFVRLVVKKAVPSECQECECVADNAMSGQAICHHCEMNPIYNLMPDFDDYEYEDESMEESSEETEEEIPMVRLQGPEQGMRKNARRNRGDKVVRRPRKGRE